MRKVSPTENERVNILNELRFLHLRGGASFSNKIFVGKRALCSGGKRANVRIYGFNVGVSKHIPKGHQPLIDKYVHTFDIFYELLDHAQEWATPKVNTGSSKPAKKTQNLWSWSHIFPCCGFFQVNTET